MATVCNLVITVPLSVSLVLVLEAMARGSAFVTLCSSSSSKHSSCSDELIDDDIDVTSHDTDASCLLTKTAAGSVELTSMSGPEKVSLEEEGQIIESENPRSLLVVGEKKIELADLCGMFLGQRGKYSFIIIVRSVCVCVCVWINSMKLFQTAKLVLTYYVSLFMSSILVSTIMDVCGFTPRCFRMLLHSTFPFLPRRMNRMSFSRYCLLLWLYLCRVWI